MQTLMRLLAEDVTLGIDGGGKVNRLRCGWRGAVARVRVGTQRFLPEGDRVEMTEVNGEPTLIIGVSGLVF